MSTEEFALSGDALKGTGAPQMDNLNAHGFMTADPRVIKSAYTINELSYIEAMELCNFGAKVVYPPTIYPVCVKNIPIKKLA